MTVPGAVGVGAGVVAAALLLLLALRPSKSDGEVAARDRALDAEDEAAPESLAPAHPFRQHARRVVARLAPRTSGRGAVFAVATALLLTAGLVPTALHLPRWVEFEAVLGCWWLAFATTLTVLLYRGERVTDDYVFIGFGARRSPEKKSSGSSSFFGNLDLPDGCSGCSGCSGDGEGFLIALVVIVGVLFALGALWVLVEIAAPLLVFFTYALLVRALRQVANDKHGCSGNLARSIGWGALWAAIYVGPLAGIVFIVHRAMNH
ncbi:MAG: hypothetical protein U0271_33285 [Polyangiaceae bacterium]